jgi:polyhydroxyalkanoate synthesis regulator phasin
MANKIETCVRDLVQIAEGSRNLEMAKALVENLLDDAKFQHQREGARFPTAQQLRDALSPVYNALAGGAQQFIGDVIDWLRSEHLRRTDGTPHQ